MDHGETLYLMKVPHGDPIQLNDSAAAIWLAAIEGGDPVASLADSAGVDPASITEQITQVLDQLVSAGVLEPVR